MAAARQRLKYLIFCARRAFLAAARACPSCGARESEVVDRKYGVTTLRRCQRCFLLYRAPTTSAAEQAEFYQDDYRQGFTTDLPDDATLQRYLAAGFSRTEKDYGTYLRVLEALGARPGQRLFDLGCSWGYGTWQFRQRGFDVDAFEISSPRAEFARTKLDLNVASTLSGIEGPYDVFFSAHVLEHVPSIQAALDFARRVLKPGGLFVAITPNGSQAHRECNRKGWHRLWGLVHPNMLDDTYYRARFATHPFLLASTPYNLEGLAQWRAAPTSQTVLDLSGDELLAAFLG